MRLVIADTGPINYLVLVGHVDVLPRLFERIILPTEVQAELSDRDAPLQVQAWMARHPSWIEVVNAPVVARQIGIHRGEAAAIALAGSIRADLLLMDDRKGVNAAKRQGIRVTGTLGVLDLAAERGLLDFHQAIIQLQRTTFRLPDAIVNALLAKHKRI